MPGTDPALLTAEEMLGLFARRALSPVEVLQAITERVARLNPGLNAFAVMNPRALDAAGASAGRWRAGRPLGLLDGVPCTVKDLVDVARLPTRRGSRLTSAAPVADDAPAVTGLKAAGAVIIAKTTTTEFGWKSPGDCPLHGITRNPWNPAYTTGGSSSGSAAAVAAGMCFAALGTDTAGSIRLPAACCGVVGFKPTYGAVPVAGIIPLAWSYDHAGPLASTVQDAAAVFAVLSGQDQDWTPPQGLRCGVARQYFCDDLAPEVAAGFERALDTARNLGWELHEIELAHDEDRKASNAESWAFHAPWVAERSELYDPGTLPRIVNGRKVTVEQYVEARRALELFRETHRDGVPGVDAVLSPTSPILPPTLESFATPEARRQELVMLRNTRPFNVLGWPTVSLPTSAMTGVQVSARWDRDWLALSAARSLEQALGKKF